ncbi:MAG: hypothetical protein P8K08_03515 [Fuerstiella sp.]|nr:hypothetical protein [Fuerstiella sp.]
MAEKETHDDLAEVMNAAARWREKAESSSDETSIRDGHKELLQKQLLVLKQRVNALNDRLSAIKWTGASEVDRREENLSALKLQGEEIRILRKFDPVLLNGPDAIEHNGKYARSWTLIVLNCAELAWAPLMITGIAKLPEDAQLDFIRRGLYHYESSLVSVNLDIEFDGLFDQIRLGKCSIPGPKPGGGGGGGAALPFGIRLNRPKKLISRKGERYSKLQAVNWLRSGDRWYAFMAMLSSHPTSIAADEAVPEKKPAARRTLKNRMNEDLKPWGLRIESGTKWSIEEISADM